MFFHVWRAWASASPGPTILSSSSSATCPAMKSRLPTLTPCEYGHGSGWMPRAGRTISFLPVSIMIPLLLRDVAALDRDRCAVEGVDHLADAHTSRLAREQVCLGHGEPMELDHAID